MKKAVVLGAGGFIGNHLVDRLKALGYYVRGVDIKQPEYSTSNADQFFILDLREKVCVERAFNASWNYYSHSFTQTFDEVYQLAADMGGAGYIFSGDHDADVMHNSATINLNVLNEMLKTGTKKVFYSSSACMYPEHNQTDPTNPNCEESSAYPANPDSEYGWEKLFSERLYLAYKRNYNIDVRIARFHNIFGPLGSYNNGKEKAPAAICRKIAEVQDNGTIDVWGDGKQTRSFLYVEECLDGVMKLMESDFTGPVNIGSDEMITINQLVEKVAKIAGKKININHISGPLGVRGRNSDNRLIKERLGWTPSKPVEYGLEKTYSWIETKV
jgi:nucleoside-diphosphate-sugar epimerase